jgi:hypothetical protein
MAQTEQPADRRQMSPTTRAVGFFVFTAVGIAALAAVVVLPEYMQMVDLENQRQALTHRLACEQKLAQYNQQLIEGVQSDPVLATRLLMRHGNYRLAGAQEVQAPGNRPISTVPYKLLEDSLNPPPPKRDELYRWGYWLDDGSTRFYCLLLSLGVLVCGMLLFGPRRKT